MLDVAEGEGAAGMDPAEFLNFKSETQENIDNCLHKNTARTFVQSRDTKALGCIYLQTTLDFMTNVL